MTGKERREAILKMLKKSDRQISGGALARQFSVSRQVIVQDIALLRLPADMCCHKPDRKRSAACLRSGIHRSRRVKR